LERVDTVGWCDCHEIVEQPLSPPPHQDRKAGHCDELVKGNTDVLLPGRDYQHDAERPVAPGNARDVEIAIRKHAQQILDPVKRLDGGRRVVYGRRKSLLVFDAAALPQPRKPAVIRERRV
jgi:hypothetical protein